MGQVEAGGNAGDEYRRADEESSSESLV